MREFRGVLSERIVRSPGVESFRFTLAVREQFVPGQFVQVIFDQGNRDNRDLNKYLSLSSSPTREYIEVTKRLSESVFSRRLSALQGGDEVLFKGPMGSCVLDERCEKVAFLIGGIGITPVISMFEYIADKRLPTDVCLVYSNRTDGDIAFKHKLDYWQRVNPRIKIAYTVTECAPHDTTCSFGAIDARLIRERMCDWHDRLFYIFGPPRMVEAMSALCVGLGVPKDRIRAENFIGY